MPREFSRGRRIADLIQRELAILIQMEVKDPRVGMVTVNEVTVSRDLAYADVYFTMFPAENYQECTQALNNAAGFLRSKLAKKLSTRVTPRLRFHFDETIEKGARISKAINDAIREDENNQQNDPGDSQNDQQEDKG
jgi:ribosome-binding factor A